MYCIYCGTENPDVANYCMSCGNKIHAGLNDDHGITADDVHTDEGAEARSDKSEWEPSGKARRPDGRQASDRKTIRNETRAREQSGAGDRGASPAGPVILIVIFSIGIILGVGQLGMAIEQIYEKHLQSSFVTWISYSVFRLVFLGGVLIFAIYKHSIRDKECMHALVVLLGAAIVFNVVEYFVIPELSSNFLEEAIGAMLTNTAISVLVAVIFLPYLLISECVKKYYAKT